MKLIQIGETNSRAVMLDPLNLVDTRCLIQGNSGGGKSYLLRLIAEQAIGQIQTVILDPEGEFASLREMHDLLLLIGNEGEIKTNVKAAGLLARKLCELNVSAVVDLYDLPLHDRRKFVRLFLESLMDVPRALWHPMLIMIDESHLFCPEKSAGESEATAAVIALMSQGRKRGFAGMLATQRLSKLHKDAAAEANNVFIGRTWLDVDQQRAISLLGMPNSDRSKLRDLHPGQFYGFGPALNQNGVIVFDSIKAHTTHPEAGKRHKMVAPAPSDAIKQIIGTLADLPEQAAEEARTLADAQTRIQKLERELRARPKLEVDPAAIDRAVAETEKRLGKVYSEWEQKYQVQIEALTKQLAQIRKLTEVPEFITPVAERPKPTQVAPKPQGVVTALPSPRASNNSTLPKGELAVLTVAAQYPRGATREQITILTGYKRSSRDAYLHRLRGSGYIEQTGELIFATAEGEAALGPHFEPLPTGEALQNYWLERLPEGERKFLAILLNSYPQAVTRQALSDATDYQRSSRDAYLQRLKARKLIVVNGSDVRASDVFFE